MLIVDNVWLSFGKRVLFKEVNLSFSKGNCYGLIGANGAGKSTFLKILSKEIEPDQGSVSINPDERLAVLSQNQFAFDDFNVIDTVIMGHKKLYDVLKEREILYEKTDFTDEDGIRASELEIALSDLDGYEAESKAATILSGLGIPEDLLHTKMSLLEGGQKVRVLLAQAIFDNPDVLLLDEPTNNLDLKSISWLEEFLSRYENTVIVVSHDRHFLNRICTHVCDIDFEKIKIYTGNYDFWYQASQLAQKQTKEDNKRKTEKIAELQEFIQRFASNVAKSKQATSRRKLIEKLTPEDMPASSRRIPYIAFKPDRKCGNIILKVDNLSVKIGDTQVLKNFSCEVQSGDKIAFVGANNLAKTTLFQILDGKLKPDSGVIKFGETITYSYFPKENSEYFSGDLNLVDWLFQFSKDRDKDESYIRGFLGRMLFSKDEALKKVSVLSGGEKVRCMLSKMMLSGANLLILDEPTNHLDLESITSLNNGLINFPEVILFSSHDHELVNSVSNRIIEFTPGGIIDRRMQFDEYIVNSEIIKLRDELYHGHKEVEL